MPMLQGVPTAALADLQAPFVRRAQTPPTGSDNPCQCSAASAVAAAQSSRSGATSNDGRGATAPGPGSPGVLAPPSATLQRRRAAIMLHAHTFIRAHCGCPRAHGHRSNKEGGADATLSASGGGGGGSGVDAAALLHAVQEAVAELAGDDGTVTAAAELGALAGNAAGAGPALHAPAATGASDASSHPPPRVLLVVDDGGTLLDLFDEVVTGLRCLRALLYTGTAQSRATVWGGAASASAYSVSGCQPAARISVAMRLPASVDWLASGVAGGDTTTSGVAALPYLAALAECVVHVAPLATGYSRDVTGRLTLQARPRATAGAGIADRTGVEGAAQLLTQPGPRGLAENASSAVAAAREQPACGRVVGLPGVGPVVQWLRPPVRSALFKLGAEGRAKMVGAMAYAP
jgi:hypothetical protein